MAHKKAGGSTRNGRDSNPKYLRRKHSMKQMGHRQYYTDIKITGIEG